MNSLYHFRPQSPRDAQGSLLIEEIRSFELLEERIAFHDASIIAKTPQSGVFLHTPL